MFYNLRKRLRRATNRYIYPLSNSEIQKVLTGLGVGPDMVLCVHSALGSLGHLKGGPQGLIAAIRGALGPSGTLMMPTFSMGGSMASYVESGERFDVSRSPSRTGALTEVFRQLPGVVRSLHPTNSVAALGPHAGELLRDHEKSPTPYGDETPFGRLARMEEGYLLMMGTHAHSILHHLQERADFPNLFLPEDAELEFVDGEGAVGRLRTRVMRPRVPYFVALADDTGAGPNWAILHDFALMFPRGRRRHIQKAGYSLRGVGPVWNRRRELEKAGILRTTRLGRTEVGLLKTKEFIEQLTSELKDSFARFGDEYTVEKVEALGLPYS